MISRRAVALGLVTYPFALAASQRTESSVDEPSYELTYPPFNALTDPQRFGYKEATKEQKKIACDMIRGTPEGPNVKPIDIAQHFIDTYYRDNPKLISQWPAPAEWNPLIVEFFKATSKPMNDDMTPWCAAFANWCLLRARRDGSNDASSQSFLTRYFKIIQEPQYGDLAIFTCYDELTGKSLRVGHVAFFTEKLANGYIKVVGGNQAKDGHYSIICEDTMMTGGHDTHRRVNGKYVSCTRRLNNFVRIA
jgi:uncharacterized protein (TIGR02594 family)